MLYLTISEKNNRGVTMKISTKGRYGLTIMIELAKHYGEGPIPLRQIAAEKDYLKHI